MREFIPNRSQHLFSAPSRTGAADPASNLLIFSGFLLSRPTGDVPRAAGGLCAPHQDGRDRHDARVRRAARILSAAGAGIHPAFSGNRSGFVTDARMILSGEPCHG